MNELFESMDYRQWLKDQSAEIKKAKSYFSYRFIAAKLGVNAGFIAKLFNGQVHLPLNKVTVLAEIYHLEGRQQDYFGELVRFGRAKNVKDVEIHFNRLSNIRGMDYRTIADSHEHFFSQWHHMAMRSLLSIMEFNGSNYRQLANSFTPRITVEEAKTSIALLQQLKLIHFDEQKQVYRVNEQFISTGEKWSGAFIREYQKKVTELAANAQKVQSRTLTDFSTLTLPFAKNQLDTIRERIRAFRQEMLMLSNECDPSEYVYQLNLQLFPVARTPKKRGEK